MKIINSYVKMFTRLNSFLEVIMTDGTYNVNQLRKLTLDCLCCCIYDAFTECSVLIICDSEE